MNTQKKPDITTPKSKKKYFSRKKDFVMLGIGIISIVYLLNFTLGFIEFLPDALPLVGNIDEVLVSGILLSVLNYFNIDLTKFFKRK